MAEQYSNRTDLQNPANKIARSAAKGQTYGKAGEQMEAQRAVPMGSPPTDTAAALQPGQLGAFNRPTERPNEPVTSGSPFGPGRTPTTRMAVPRNNDNVLTELRAIYAAYPSDELADMLESYVREGY